MRIIVRDVIVTPRLLSQVFVRHFAVRRPTSATAQLAARQPLYFGCDVGPINCQGSRAAGSLTGSAGCGCLHAGPRHCTTASPRHTLCVL